MGFPGGTRGKECLPLQETWVQSLGWEKSPGEGDGNALQYSCLENPIDRGAWQAAVHGVTKNLLKAMNRQVMKDMKETYMYITT